MTFEEMGLDPKILEAIKELGFESPMPIQEKIIPILLKEDNIDVVGLAQTGTGKTAAFGLPIIQKVNTKLKRVQYLILSPTRELCLQIADDLQSFAKYKPDINIAAIFGGASIEKQIQKIQKGVHIISATPGRLLDLINRNVVDLSNIKTVVLDEADEMLNMGFRDELEGILVETPGNKNTLLFSATMPNEVMAIAKNYMHEPIEISIGKKNTGAENVEHLCYFVHAKDRYLALKRIVDYFPNIYGIIFCRTRKETQEVAEALMNDGYNADALHGDLSQAQRDTVMNKFRIKHLKLLVATDVAARGIDVDSLTHIINYNLPDENEVYTHRSGRTGRAGKKGISIIIAGLKEKSKIKLIEKQINKTFKYLEVPTGKEVCEKQLFHLIDTVEKTEVDYSQIDPYLPTIFKKLEWLDYEELIKKFVSVQFNRFLDYYKNMPDLSTPIEPKKNKSGKKNSSYNFTRFFINLGRTDDLRPNTLIGMINDFTGKRDIEIGEIEILQNYSFFEVESDFTDLILRAFKDKKLKKRDIIVEISESKKNGNKGRNNNRNDGKDNKKSFRGDSERKHSRKSGTKIGRSDRPINEQKSDKIRRGSKNSDSGFKNSNQDIWTNFKDSGRSGKKKNKR
jgi:ATP-dependent RNA helicase DeaD